MTIKPRSESAANATEAPVTRERILLEAARLFRHHGFAATTLREVADAAGVKAGSIYYHFESKEEILGEVLDKGITSSQKLFAPVLTLFQRTHPGVTESPLASKATSGECSTMATSRRPTFESMAKSQPTQKIATRSYGGLTQTIGIGCSNRPWLVANYAKTRARQ